MFTLMTSARWLLGCGVVLHSVYRHSLRHLLMPKSYTITLSHREAMAISQLLMYLDPSRAFDRSVNKTVQIGTDEFGAPIMGVRKFMTTPALDATAVAFLRRKAAIVQNSILRDLGVKYPGVPFGDVMVDGMLNVEAQKQLAAQAGLL